MKNEAENRNEVNSTLDVLSVTTASPFTRWFSLLSYFLILKYFRSCETLYLILSHFSLSFEVSTIKVS